METNLLLTLFVTSAVLCAATFAACHWWYGRKLAASAQRLEKSEKARQFSAQQTLQARKQIETLQKDLALLQRGRAEAEAAQARERNLREVLAAAAPPTPSPRQAAAPDRLDDPATATLVNGFADTLPMVNGFADTLPM